MPPAEPDPIGTDLSRARRARKLRRDAACVLCGRDDPEALRRVQRSTLELHHLAGAENDATMTVVLCLNCHRLQSARQPGAGIELEQDPDRTMLDRLVYVLRGLALFFDELARALAGWANRLADLIAALDAEFPGWRSLGPARG